MAAAQEADLFCPDDEYFVKDSHAKFSTGTSDVPRFVAIAVDIETTGQILDAGPHGARTPSAMVELGAVAFDQRNPDVPIAVFEGFMGVPGGCGWDPKTVTEFWMRTPMLKRKSAQISRKTGDASTSMQAFVSWVNDVATAYTGGDGKRITFYSDNPAYDVKWIDTYMTRHTDHATGSLNTFFGEYAPVVDTESYALGLARVDTDAFATATADGSWFSPDNVAAEAVGMDDYVPLHDLSLHRAAYDAVEIFRRHKHLINHLREKIDESPKKTA